MHYNHFFSLTLYKATFHKWLTMTWIKGVKVVLKVCIHPLPFLSLNFGQSVYVTHQFDPI